MKDIKSVKSIFLELSAPKLASTANVPKRSEGRIYYDLFNRKYFKPFSMKEAKIQEK